MEQLSTLGIILGNLDLTAKAFVILKEELAWKKLPERPHRQKLRLSLGRLVI
jgi:hypothetical protein